MNFLQENRTLNVAGAVLAVPSVLLSLPQVELLKSTLGSYNQSFMNSHGRNKSKPVHSSVFLCILHDHRNRMAHSVAENM